jgi:hypothetical protein
MFHLSLRSRSLPALLPVPEMTTRVLAKTEGDLVKQQSKESATAAISEAQHPTQPQHILFPFYFLESACGFTPVYWAKWTLIPS